MVFIETPIFTRRISALLTDEAYRRLQTAILINPAAAPMMEHGGGLRKTRWSAPGKGKRGGIRVVYYFDVDEDTVYMLFAYAKSAQADLTRDQLRELRRIVERWLAE